jgi:hypothetical protein
MATYVCADATVKGRGSGMPYRDRIDAPWPKKLLALDGSGIRGVITLEVLRRQEPILAERLGGRP